ncbi:unnamed protein product [Paramecium pentaurelia]|uniref:Transmembrane protein n=1 Tax=Paramecium pentaurelia TaxID=43138 RepID=A0A8S1W6N7_9CILI|nr:unnamed protein product [Paramecium pentaurelia]
MKSQIILNLLIISVLATHYKVFDQILIKKDHLQSQKVELIKSIKMPFYLQTISSEQKELSRFQKSIRQLLKAKNSIIYLSQYILIILYFRYKNCFEDKQFLENFQKLINIFKTISNFQELIQLFLKDQLKQQIMIGTIGKIFNKLKEIQLSYYIYPN